MSTETKVVSCRTCGKRTGCLRSRWDVGIDNCWVEDVAMSTEIEKKPHGMQEACRRQDSLTGCAPKPLMDTEDPNSYMEAQETAEQVMIRKVEELAQWIRDLTEENNQMRAAVRMYRASNEKIAKQRDEQDGRILVLEQEIRNLEARLESDQDD